MKDIKKSQPEFYLKNNPSQTNKTVNSRLTNMDKTFREALQGKLAERNIKPASLARQSGVSKQNIGRILNDAPHSVTGAKPQPSRETVKKLARALEWSLSEALLSAGYAPVDTPKRFKIFTGVTLEFENGDFSAHAIEELLSACRLVVAGVVALTTGERPAETDSEHHIWRALSEYEETILDDLLEKHQLSEKGKYNGKKRTNTG
jgi:transcriptional regulator with XRE-family HTH domain